MKKYTRHDAKLMLSSGDDRAVATVTVAGLVGASAARSGRDEQDALCRALRGLADAIEGDRRAVRRASGASWVRLSVDVDVLVPLSEIGVASSYEDRAKAGDMEAGQSMMDLALQWLSTGMYDREARNWQCFDWAMVEDCDPDDFPEA